MIARARGGVREVGTECCLIEPSNRVMPWKVRGLNYPIKRDVKMMFSMFYFLFVFLFVFSLLSSKNKTWKVLALR